MDIIVLVIEFELSYYNYLYLGRLYKCPWRCCVAIVDIFLGCYTYTALHYRTAAADPRALQAVILRLYTHGVDVAIHGPS